MNKRTFLIISIIMSVGLAGCSKAKPANLALTGSQASASNATNQRDVMTYSGKMTGVVETNIFAKTPGRIASVQKDVGEQVNVGDVLVTLETTDLQAQLASAKADLALAEAKYNEIKRGTREEDIRSSEAAYQQAYQKYLDVKKGKRPQEIAKLNATLNEAKQAYDLAKVKYDRIKALYEQGATSKQSLDDAEIALRQAETKYFNAKNELSLALEGPTEETLNALKANVDQTKAMLDKAKNGPTKEAIEQNAASVAKARALVQLHEYNLQNGVIKSPIKGFVATKNANAGEMANPSAPLMTIVNLDRVYLVVSVPEKDLKYMKIGNEVNVNVEAIGKTMKGKVSMISPKADPGTDKFTVKIILNNASHELRAGMTGIVIISKS
ncbi:MULTISPECIES: HlyD family secretion protein [Aneurinibacillus]|uniref:Efflux RND transporter periplasmic adaptor subunit n=1 Tax=Aneurinibacillus thermoaerophilus TaxID=143495 RepID=A0ABX8Y6U3_ANETH|nr:MULTISPECIES: efflux RND transporter periplasmic adaptor subunit [Aneurinibacillus]AMA72847.1 hypothetical protein ACH33_08260 [Aneurinibacillus sp. XH2]MED0680070.1 efflux RND transporter periplasmic adaptor subunit [Aneurinibacillus thermoaerophilus]MED0738172.1 efflux RND transporter periplasmic adaptor subunit [Aneurinibacillus thermoaerophilus]MED0763448.1 efflux RND transporter periplasmic adaptor subunit [Aneurinibacillus thermoaerophilus]QYY41393.1 efflux RND transporter periplasmic